MRMVNDLEVVAEPSKIHELMRRVEGRPDDRWRRDREPVKRFEKMLSAPIEAFCFSIENEPGRPAATLWFERRGPSRLVVSNIVPAERRALTDEEYNAILDEFESSLLRPLAEGLGVDLRTISPGVKLEASLSREAMEMLRSFSATANRSGLHPLDWRRWGRFLIQTHLDGPTLDGTDLDWWLDQEGWPEEMRRLLVGSYETGLSLLAEYDEERVPS